MKPAHLAWPRACLLLAVWGAGCANRPESIHASYVSHEKFAPLSCQQLFEKQSQVRADLDQVSRLQDSKANADAVGVFLLGIPFSKLSGDHEADVARLKGELEALDTALAKAGCLGAAPQLPAPAAPAAADPERRLARLADLKARGLVTEEEYARQRQRLLDELLDARGAPAAAVATAPWPAPPAQARSEPLNGLQLTLRDSDSYSGVTLGEVDVHLSAATPDGYELNGGAIVLDPRGLVLRGALPGLALTGAGGGVLARSSSVQARLVSPAAGVPPVDVRLSVLGEQRLRVGGHELPAVRVAVSGFTAGAAVGFNYRPGLLVAGELVVEPHTGIILAGALQSQAAAYAFKREVVRARPRQGGRTPG